MRRLINDESGAVLVIAAIVMLLMMGIAALSLDGGRGLNEERDSQNAADQASLAAAWAQCNGRDPQMAGLASAATNGFNNDGTTNTVTITDLGNGRFDAVVSSSIDGTFSKTVGVGTITARSQAVATCSISTGLGGFALFSGSTSCGPVDLNLTGAAQVIEGGVHSNDQLMINGNAGSPSSIYGPVTATVSVAHHGVLFYDNPGDTTESTPGTNPTQGVPVRPYPADYDIADYAPGGSQAAAPAAAGEYFSYTTDRVWTNETLASGLYYVDGDVDIRQNVLGEHITIVATGQIQVRGNGNMVNTIADDSNPLYGPYDPTGLALFSTYRNALESCNRDAIKWSGSAHVWGGIQYAPFGNVDMSGASNVSFNGSIIAYNINLSGSDMTISYNDDFEGTPSTIINLEE